MSEELILYRVDQQAAWITFNRPERLNALCIPLIQQLLQRLEEARCDPEVTCIVLTGAGDKAFCAGADIDDFLSKPEMEQYAFREEFCHFFEHLCTFEKPLIARLNGYALGGGFGVAMACDMIVASERATMGTPEVNIGLFPMIIMAVLSRNIGRKKLLELMLTGERITAQEAERLGMINHVVPHEELDHKVQQLVRQLASKSPVTLQLGRQAYYTMADMDFSHALAYLKGMLAVNLRTDDAREGLDAFLNKRQPHWKGH